MDYYSWYSFRPVVQIKSNYWLEDNGSGGYNLIDNGGGIAEDTGTYSSTASNHNWRKQHSVTVKVTDNVGLASNVSLQYGWSTSTTTAPTTWNTLSFGNSAGATSATKTITQNGGVPTGKLYLWIKGTNITDTSGNKNSTTIKTGQYWFDTTPPLITAGVSEDDGLLRYYEASLNIGAGRDGSTTTWKDLSGNSDGTLSGGTWSQGVTSHEYLLFDGIDDYVDIGTLNITNEVTFEVEVTLNSIQSGYYGILSVGGSNGDIALMLQNGIPYFQKADRPNSQFPTARK